MVADLSRIPSARSCSSRSSSICARAARKLGTQCRRSALLLVEVEPEAQARRIDRGIADLAQPPYSRMLRQGICDPSQARRVGDGGEAVADLREGFPPRLGPAGHVVVGIRQAGYDLRCRRRWMCRSWRGPWR